MSLAAHESLLGPATAMSTRTPSPSFPGALGPALTRAVAQKGFTTLTSVQTAVLDPALSGRDLRITSQTGSGKTVAVGFALRDLVAESAPRERGASAAAARPRAILVAPTRELAKQVDEELSWLFEPLGARVVSVTGGASVRDERRALAAGPAVVVGTPGRLLDHLKRGAIDTTAVGAVVLDEADRLLDMGFREDLDAILALIPEGHRTHLVSATFPPEVRALADATQDAAVHVEGTRLGAANVDIDHVVHLIDARQRVDAIVNLLLGNPDEQTLIFARTRAEVASIARELVASGFAASSLSGEMDQAARNRALAAFKSGGLRVLVATDVAARGIDVQDIARVIHAEPPTDADAYTHRSGRTGRAGRKGKSSILASIPELARTLYLLKRANVAHKFEAIPAAESIRAGADARAFAALTAEVDAERGGLDERTWALAKRIVAEGDPTRAVARLLARTRFAGPSEPRAVRVVEAHGPPRGGGRAPVGLAGERAGRNRGGSWVPFLVTWGSEKHADARRLLAMVCRRGNIRGSEVGSIRVDRTHSTVDVASHVADAFAAATSAPDPREPGVVIRSEQGAAGRQERERRPHPAARPYSHPHGHGGAPPKRRAR